jgi:hypothetical protein
MISERQPLVCVLLLLLGNSGGAESSVRTTFKLVTRHERRLHLAKPQRTRRASSRDRSTQADAAGDTPAAAESPVYIDIDAIEHIRMVTSKLDPTCV